MAFEAFFMHQGRNAHSVRRGSLQEGKIIVFMILEPMFRDVLPNVGKGPIVNWVKGKIAELLFRGPEHALKARMLDHGSVPVQAFVCAEPHQERSIPESHLKIGNDIVKAEPLVLVGNNGFMCPCPVEDVL